MRLTLPEASTSLSSSKLRTSISIFKFLLLSFRYLLALSIACDIPPAKSIWLSLSSIISYKPILWLQPPPISTASFSSIRSPGVVLRVSSIRVRVPSSSFTYSRVRVAIPLIRCIMLSIRRSVCSNDRTLPTTSKAMSLGFTSSPSCIYCVMRSSLSNISNTFLATSMPAIMPVSLTISLERPMASAGIQQSVVWSPSPISSANQCFISCSSIFCRSY